VEKPVERREVKISSRLISAAYTLCIYPGADANRLKSSAKNIFSGVCNQMRIAHKCTRFAHYENQKPHFQGLRWRKRFEQDLTRFLEGSAG
jgi:hypothetical protein